MHDIKTETSNEKEKNILFNKKFLAKHKKKENKTRSHHVQIFMDITRYSDMKTFLRTHAEEC